MESTEAGPAEKDTESVVGPAEVEIEGIEADQLRRRFKVERLNQMRRRFRSSIILPVQSLKICLYFFNITPNKPQEEPCLIFFIVGMGSTASG